MSRAPRSRGVEVERLAFAQVSIDHAARAIDVETNAVEGRLQVLAGMNPPEVRRGSRGKKRQELAGGVRRQRSLAHVALEQGIAGALIEARTGDEIQRG